MEKYHICPISVVSPKSEHLNPPRIKKFNDKLYKHPLFKFLLVHGALNWMNTVVKQNSILEGGITFKVIPSNLHQL